MIRWLGAFLWRVVCFWSLWMASAFGLLLLAMGATNPPGLGKLFLMALFCTTALLLFSEWSLLNRSLLAMAARLRDAQVPVPPRMEMKTRSCLALLLTAPFWGVFHILLMIARQEQSDEALALVLLRTGVWTVLSLLVLTLILGGISRLRFKAALRVVPREQHPSLRPVLPWVMAAWGTGALLLTLIGPPSPRTMATAMQLAMTASLISDELEPDRDELELILELGSDDNILEVALPLFLHGASIRPAFPEHRDQPDLRDMWLVTVPASQARALIQAMERDSENVDTIQLNAAVSAAPLQHAGACQGGFLSGLPVNDPLASAQRELKLSNSPLTLGALKLLRPSRPAIVAVIDTGIDGTHPDLRKVVRSPISDDQDGHGTAVAGLIGAEGDNGEGVTSLNLGGRFIQLRSYAALAVPSPAAQDIAEAVLDATDDGVDVINLSFGAQGVAPRAVQLAIGAAIQKGVIVVASAGNQPQMSARDQWPANISGVIVVGALDTWMQPASFSSSLAGIQQGIWAPGTQVCTLTAGGYASQSGTSMAAPMVSGAMGVLRAVCPNISGRDALRLLHEDGIMHHISGLPILDLSSALLGFVREPERCR